MRAMVLILENSSNLSKSFPKNPICNRSRSNQMPYADQITEMVSYLLFTIQYKYHDLGKTISPTSFRILVN